MRNVHIWALPVLLAGCAPGVAAVPTGLTPPAPSLMVAPVALPDAKAGDNLFDSTAQCAAAYNRETGKLIGLQRWATRVTRK